MRFEKVTGYEDVNLPKRATKGAAGYDFECARNSICKAHQITLIPTGVKAQIDPGYYLQLAVRSSTPKKKGLILANSIGIIDEDYYNNPDNEGHIMFQVYNYTDTDVMIMRNERIGQGVFLKYAVTDGDMVDNIRTGGFGSTDTNKVIDADFAQYMNNREGIAP